VVFSSSGGPSSCRENSDTSSADGDSDGVAAAAIATHATTNVAKNARPRKPPVNDIFLAANSRRIRPTDRVYTTRFKRKEDETKRVNDVNVYTDTRVYAVDESLGFRANVRVHEHGAVGRNEPSGRVPNTKSGADAHGLTDTYVIR